MSIRHMYGACLRDHSLYIYWRLDESAFLHLLCHDKHYLLSPANSWNREEDLTAVHQGLVYGLSETPIYRLLIRHDICCVTIGAFSDECFYPGIHRYCTVEQLCLGILVISRVQDVMST
jgi:hypothetical protein